MEKAGRMDLPSTPPLHRPPPRRRHVMVTRAKKRRLEEEDRLAVGDRISSLPDGVLGDIVSLLPTRDGARTQLLSSRWRQIWCTAPLNLHLPDDDDDGSGGGIVASEISRILAAHPGPCRRFVMPRRYIYRDPCRATMDGWLRTPVLDNLPELDFSNGGLLLPSAHRFSPTLRVACFRACTFPDFGDDGSSNPFQLPLLKQLTLCSVHISESSLHAMLAGCPVLESLLLLHNRGFSRLQIVSSSLRSIGVQSGSLRSARLGQLIIEDAPCLERLLYFERIGMTVSVLSAPRLAVLGNLYDGGVPRLQFGDAVFQGSITTLSVPAVVATVKVLALYDVNLSLNKVVNLMQWFPRLQNLYIKVALVWGNDWCTYQKLTTSTALDNSLRKIVVRNYKGDKSQIDLAKLFVSNAKVLESMRFEIEGENDSTKWITRQKRLLLLSKRASRGAQFHFVSPSILTGSLDDQRAEQVHDLSADPFHRFH